MGKWAHKPQQNETHIDSILGPCYNYIHVQSINTMNFTNQRTGSTLTLEPRAKHDKTRLYLSFRHHACKWKMGQRACKYMITHVFLTGLDRVHSFSTQAWLPYSKHSLPVEKLVFLLQCPAHCLQVSHQQKNTSRMHRDDVLQDGGGVRHLSDGVYFGTLLMTLVFPLKFKQRTTGRTNHQENKTDTCKKHAHPAKTRLRLQVDTYKQNVSNTRRIPGAIGIIQVNNSFQKG